MYENIYIIIFTCVVKFVLDGITSLVKYKKMPNQTQQVKRKLERIDVRDVTKIIDAKNDSQNFQKYRYFKIWMFILFICIFKENP